MSLKVENKGVFLSECKCAISGQARAGGVPGKFTNLLDKASLGVKAVSSPFWLKSELEPKGAPLKFFPTVLPVHAPVFNSGNLDDSPG